MRPLRVVKVQITTDPYPDFADCGVGAEVNLLILHRAPQALDHHIVAPSAPTVHADGDFLAQQHAGEGERSELATLVGVEYLRLVVARQCFLQCLDAEAGFRFTSTGGSAVSDALSEPNTPAAPSSNWLRHVVIWFGCTSNCCANSASVFSPFTAANATFALKAGL